MRAFGWLVFIIILLIIGLLVFRKHEPSNTAAPQTAVQSASDTPQQSAGAEQPQPNASTITTTDGMHIQTTTQGTGEGIKAGQTAVVQYEGKLADGSTFDSTAQHGGSPFEFKLGAGMVIKGWEEGIAGMKVGETRILTVPPELGYGPQGYPPVIPPNATLTFTVTLQGIK